jgi:energy-coupling factor transport system substrate-specific component
VSRAPSAPRPLRATGAAAQLAPLAAAVLFVAALGLAVPGGHSALAVVLAGFALIAAGLGAWERGPGGAKEVALVAAYAGAAAAGRVLFAAVPNVQPVTTMTACAGVALGPRAGAAVGAVAALVSDGFLGEGPYTPWQMLAWGLVGATGGLLAPLLRRSRLALVAFCFAWGLLYDLLLDLWQLAAFGPAWSWAGYTSLVARGLAFDAAHATGNAILAAVAGPALIRLLDRYGRRLNTEIEWR